MKQIMFAIIVTVAAAGCFGQQPSPQTEQPQAKSSTPAQPPAKDKKQTQTTSESAGPGTSNDRLFFTLPNFLTLENAGQVPPLTSKQKFDVVVRGSFDYVQFPWYGFLSVISQAQDSEPGYGQGWEGYGKRFGSAFADGTIEKLHDRSHSAFPAPSGPQILSIWQRELWPPDALRDEPKSDHEGRQRKARVQLF